MRMKLILPIQTFLRGLVEPEVEQKHPWLGRIWLGMLYGMGLITWGLFYNWGHFSIQFHDWAEVCAPRLQNPSLQKQEARGVYLQIRYILQSMVEEVSPQNAMLWNVSNAALACLIFLSYRENKLQRSLLTNG